MFANINVDCCKTPGCKNLGVLNSPDYVRQGKDVLCRECGFLFPVSCYFRWGVKSFSPHGKPGMERPGQTVSCLRQHLIKEIRLLDSGRTPHGV